MECFFGLSQIMYFNFLRKIKFEIFFQKFIAIDRNSHGTQKFTWYTEIHMVHRNSHGLQKFTWYTETHMVHRNSHGTQKLTWYTETMNLESNH